MQNTLSEQELIAACKEGKKFAQEQFFKINANKMFAVCLRYTNTREDAEDVLQEGFIKVFKNLNKFEAKGSLEGWVRRIFVNTAIEHYRKNAKWQYAEDAQNVVLDSGDISILHKLKADDLLQLVSKLPLGYRTVFNMFAIEGFAHQEIAKTLNISESTSKTQLFKARAALQQMIKKIGE